MIYQHEIPKGARLYFNGSARLKRAIEQRASEVLYKYGFEEIVTPYFSYHQHKILEDETELIRLGDEKNRKLTIRADSTVDVVRLITNRLGRSTKHKRWFYIQPVFRYPTQEFYQIGAEVLEGKRSGENLKIVLEILAQLGITPILQLSNIKIPKILSQKYGIDIEIFKELDLDRLLACEHSWMEPLLELQSVEEIDDLVGILPQEIEVELMKIKELAQFINYDNTIIAPLYYANMRYYKDLFFRFFIHNNTIATGGDYETQEIMASGFAIYTDQLIALMEKGE
ncbi:ATP phosphoribosyltransferase regulatory subunit [Nitratiruptor sp. YY09-18]|uniref:ATP phosphoribosyltransferase regulatory subunit n=1 Tax=Nitratiruptor sp. YY09-18 TaxID=2724901 RepID=UPI0019158310|nr:ATP phosphoribosyltransferase regulatory subunit [Nitratiruptor sp. YY09-18]BCD68754.1 hypothetical protein NitYY0918_C1671 [Nitratiruptor sp. YY09-18]